MLALKYSISVFFFPPPTLFIYLCIMASEIGVVFEQFDEKASIDIDVEGGERNLLAEDNPTWLPVIEVFFKWILASIRVPLTAQVKRKQRPSVSPGTRCQSHYV